MPNISNTCESICQSFAEKVESKVNSFENSVSTNQFKESVAIMTNLSDSLNVLHDHLDHQNIETKYLRLKDYFIKYLNNSVKD